MKKRIPLLLLPPLLVAGLMFFVLYEGPRMRSQHHIREFQMNLPGIPAGTQPALPVDRLPTPPEAARLANPVPATPENLTRARVYYTYYCLFCHGDSGAGDGPVGQSYLPRPADLRTPHTAARGDGEILRAMLTGTGHEPVLQRVVPPEHRWYLALLVRSLARR